MGYETNGLLSGLANGIKEGLITYQNQQNIQHQQKMQELMSGYTKDENGALVPTPEKQQEMAAKQAGYKQQIEESTPGSATAKASATLLGKSGFQVPDGLSYSQQKGLVEPLVLAKTKAQAMRDASMNRFEHSDLNIDKKLKSTQEGAAQKDWSKQFGNSSPMTQRLEGASRMQNLIKAGEEGKIATTKQFLARANAEMTALETGRNSFPLGSQERTEMDSYAADLQSTLNKVFNEQKGSDLKPLLKELKANISDMSDSYMDQAERAATMLEEGAPDFGAESLQKKHGLLKKQYSKAFGHWGRQAEGGGLVGAQPQKVKVSNGKETLLIDPADLQHAIADGFKQVGQ